MCGFFFLDDERWLTRVWCCVAISLEVRLQKASEGAMWPELVMGDRRGEYVINSQQAALIHQRLSHLTSEHLVRLPSTFNLQIIFSSSL